MGSEKNLRVLHIVADGAPGGGTTIVASLVQDLGQRKGIISALATQANSLGLKAAQDRNLNTFGIEFFRSRLSFGVVRAIKAVIDEFRPHIVHAHGARAALPTVLASMSMKRRPKLLYTVRGYHFQNKPLHRRLLGALAERIIHYYVDITVFVSKADQREGRRWHILPPNKHSQVIYNGIEADAFPPPRPRDRRRIAFLGRLCYQKNPQLMVRISSHLKGQGFQVTMIGGGELEEETRDLVRSLEVGDFVTVTGVQPRDNALKLLDQCGMMVLPTRWEGLPVVCQEALAMGIPSIVSPVNGCPEVVLHDQTGLLVDSQDPAVWADAIRTLAADEERCLKMGERGRALVDEKFTRPRMVEEHVEAYGKLLPEYSHLK